MMDARYVLRQTLGFAPTRRLAVLAAWIAPFWLMSGSRAGAGVAILGSIALVSAAVLDAALLPEARDLALRRDLPATLGVGDTVAGCYRIESRWGRALLLTVHDAPPPALLDFAGREGPVSLAPGGGLDLPFRATARARRGRPRRRRAAGDHAAWSRRTHDPSADG